jgi:sulfur carrier protein
MRILLNGAWLETEATELSAALRQFGYADAVVATAVNGEFVATAARGRTPLADGDRVEVLAPMQGG